LENANKLRKKLFFWSCHRNYLPLQTKFDDMKKITIKLPLLAKIGIAIVLGVVLSMFMPGWFVRGMNTFNALFSEFLKFIIPLIIIAFITPAIAEVGYTAKRMLIITVALAYGATIISGLIGYGASALIFPNVIGMREGGEAIAQGSFPPYFQIGIPPVMDVMSALVAAFILGLGIVLCKAQNLQRCFVELSNIVTGVIQGIIIPLLPFYIFGIFLNMGAEGSVKTTIFKFAAVIGIIFVLTVLLLIFQYSVAGAIARKNPFKALWNMLPAYATALGTSSSAATIPVTLEQAKKNGVSPEVAGFVIPLCATIHLSGSTIKIVCCSMAIILLNGMDITFGTMFGFIMMLGITMVAAPGVPGGAIMAALGILESILGFNAEQQAMMIMLYIAMDSFGTACNVTGDGAIAMIVERLRSKEQ